ncbi:3-dehydroquinate synthase [Chondromyces apiculatus]|uniref:Multifunctional fusion protein n=1 Tax=Chondromyces apiculatus DSM 436 TaxID=1192034 RepID=A0A017T2D2_9BACT|nr:3-dehydroquinate synthase [Chondromyces apiculatus]EYF03398.1 Shikimate kinase I [Chondromyces apiculatus DSM 436]
MDDPSRRAPLLLTGFMGAGKTTVGRLVAARAGLPFLDLDEVIARDAGAPVPAIFASEGEAGFRAREREALRRVLAAPGAQVVALGGGSLLDAALRAEALASACVVALSARAGTLDTRTRGGAPRPLLDGAADREGRVRALLAARAPVYAEAHAQVCSEGAPEEVAEDVLRAWRDAPLLVPLGSRTYGVRIAREAFASVADAVRALHPSQVLVVTDETVDRLWGTPLREALAAAGLPPRATVTLPPGEEHKHLGSVERALAAMIEAGADRDAVVVAHGGGVVTDLGGFAAATLLRGVRWVAAPTTLLAMVDASVGGKTGVDLGEAKNAVGAFHQPSAVVLGPAQLATEEERGFRSGLAEAVKAGCVGDADLVALLEREADAVLRRDEAVIGEVIRRSVAVKAGIVSRDEHEAGERVLLNFGHTLGHALEAEGKFTRLRHGEAVALGMVGELRVGEALGVTPRAVVARVERLLGRLGLPTRLSEEPVGAALRLVGHDKKRRGSGVRSVVLGEVGEAKIEEIGLKHLSELFAAAAAGD